MGHRSAIEIEDANEGERQRLERLDRDDYLDPDARALRSSLDQPPPVPNDRPAVWSLVMHDMLERDQVGRARYGTPLQPHNGRDALADAYAEALDLAVYLRQALFERDGK